MTRVWIMMRMERSDCSEMTTHPSLSDPQQQYESTCEPRSKDPSTAVMRKPTCVDRATSLMRLFGVVLHRAHTDLSFCKYRIRDPSVNG